MSSATTTSSTSNQRFTDYENAKIFVGDNNFITGNYANDTYDDVTLEAGTLMARVASTNKLVVIDKAASDGSQYPVGVLNKEWTVLAGEDQDVSICIDGDVVESGVVLPSGTALSDVIDSKTLRDRIASDTAGIVLVGGTELTDYDNS